MNRVEFFSGYMVEKSDLDYLQASLGDEIKSRTALQYSKGVMSPVGEYVGVDTNQTLKINPFQAFTNSGERINVPEAIRYLALDKTDSSKRELGTQGYLSDDEFGWESDTPYIIVARYIERGARPRPHYRTHEPHPTRIYSGFSFYAMREGIDELIVSGVNPYIILAKAVYTNGKLSVTTLNTTEYAGLDASRVSVLVGTDYTSTYDLTSRVSVSEHIGCVGDPNQVSSKNPHGLTPEILGIDSNAVPEHERIFHSAGFIGSATSRNSCFYTGVDSRSIVDFLVMYNLRTGENLHVGGITIKSYAYDNNSILIALRDGDNEANLWPDGKYTLFINLRTREVGIATDNEEVVNNRTFSVIYNQSIQHRYSPILTSQIDTSYQYILYKFTFKQEKDYTNIPLNGQGLIKSNFTDRIDYRVFGSISADNLQKDAEGYFVTNFPISTKGIRFSDNTVLTTATAYTPNYIDSALRLGYLGIQDIQVYSGVCKDSTNQVVLNFSTPMQKKINLTWSRGNSGGCLPPNVPISAGTWHVFVIGKPDGTTDIAIDKDINASNIVIADTTLSSPIDGYRYFRRVGSIFVYLDNSSQINTIRPFISVPTGNNSVEVYFNDGKTLDPNDKDINGMTILSIPDFSGNVNSQNTKVTLEISNGGGAFTQDNIFIASGYAPVSVSGNRNLYTGQMTVNTFNGKLFFSNTAWAGRVVSYTDSRII